LTNLANIYQRIAGALPMIKEPLFEYFDLAKGYEVTINFIKKGADIPSHTHDQSVFNYVFEGSFFVTMYGVCKEYKHGDWIHIEASISHSVKAETDVILLELWKK
jgi:quercetin dioxygenase-like cupin family protein